MARQTLIARQLWFDDLVDSVGGLTSSTAGRVATLTQPRAWAIAGIRLSSCITNYGSWPAVIYVVKNRNDDVIPLALGENVLMVHAYPAASTGRLATSMTFSQVDGMRIPPDMPVSLYYTAQYVGSRPQLNRITVSCTFDTFYVK